MYSGRHADGTRQPSGTRLETQKYLFDNYLHFIKLHIINKHINSLFIWSRRLRLRPHVVAGMGATFMEKKIHVVDDSDVGQQQLNGTAFQTTLGDIQKCQHISWVYKQYTFSDPLPPPPKVYSLLQTNILGFENKGLMQHNIYCPIIKFSHLPSLLCDKWFLWLCIIIYRLQLILYTSKFK